jgi:hypothetical protein
MNSTVRTTTGHKRGTQGRITVRLVPLTLAFRVKLGLTLGKEVDTAHRLHRSSPSVQGQRLPPLAVRSIKFMLFASIICKNHVSENYSLTSILWAVQDILQMWESFLLSSLSGFELWVHHMSPDAGLDKRATISTKKSKSVLELMLWRRLNNSLWSWWLGYLYMHLV